MMPTTKRILLVLAVSGSMTLLGVGLGESRADSIGTVHAYSSLLQTSYSDDGGASVGMGQDWIVVHTLRPYLSFDLTPTPFPITGLVLQGSVTGLRPVTDLGSNPFPGAEAMTVGVFDANPASDPDLETLFDDLGSGNFYGSFTIDNGIFDPDRYPTPIGPDFRLELSPTAVADANAARLAGQPFTVGMTVVDFHGYSNRSIVGDVAANLFVATAVPEPSSLTCLALGLSMLSLALWRRLARAKSSYSSFPGSAVGG